MPIAIETNELSRAFQTYQKPEGVINSLKGFWNREYKNKIALAPTNLKIEAGQIVGLVGSNGAGKTTLLKLLSGLINPTSGDASVIGYRPWERDYRFLQQISILLGQKNQLWWDISPIDSFSLLAKIYDLDKNKASKRVQELAKLLDCTHVLTTQLRRLSLGERMKMEIIGSLLHEPKILFLDEPTIGLDIVAQSTIREFLGNYVKDRGPTVILTSHYMDDIAKLANTLLLISQGQIVYNGTVDLFSNKTDESQLLKFSFTEPLNENITLSNGAQLQAGPQEYNVKIKSKEIGAIIPEISRYGTLHSLKIEETDFEDVIRDFLQTESRPL